MNKKFYEMNVDERRAELKKSGALNQEDLEAYTFQGGLSESTADHMIENVLGLYCLPVGIAQNFIVNGIPRLVPMVIEEPSVVAGASFMAKLAQAGGGFKSSMTAPEMIGQMQLLDLLEPLTTRQLILEHKEELIAQIANVDPVLSKYGGGPRDLEVRYIETSPIGAFLVLHLIFDVQDVMGANAVNTAVENLAGPVERLTGGRVHLKILSNLADRRLAKASVSIPVEALAFEGFSGEQVRDGIIEAWAFAEADPYRAATHNKGIMNGIDAVVLATANDWRAIEAGAHAYAARSGRYSSLSFWGKDDRGNLVGSLELPMAVGILGGATRVHPTAKANIKLMGVSKASELGEIIAAVGLAQNMAALRALATEGIQRGHMGLHARQIAISAGAASEQVEKLANQLVKEKNIRIERAREILAEWSMKK